MLSDAIISMIIISVSGLIGLSFKLCYSSKCKIIKCCGGEIIRDTEHEVNINMQTPNPNSI
jgi:hypothetical protein